MEVRRYARSHIAFLYCFAAVLMFHSLSGKRSWKKSVREQRDRSKEKRNVNRDNS
jgi:hypothetical protein